MSNYRYRTIWAHALREGDEIRAADKETWLRPLTRVEVPGPSSHSVKLWYRPRPAWNSSPDETVYQHIKVRIRRPIA